MDETEKHKRLFLSLIYSLQMQTMMQLGKLPNPMTGKTERELDGAQISIDMIGMLKEKSKNNLDDEEKKFLEQVIRDLQLNFIDEKNKPDSKSTDDKTTEAGKEDVKESENAKNSDEGKN